jgi:hypothetical protein
VKFDLTALLASPTPSWPVRVLVGLGAVVLTVALRLLLDAVAPGLVPYAWCSQAVLLSTAVGGWQAGAFTLLTCVSLAWYALLPPRWSWDVKSPADGIGLVLVAASGGLILVFTEALRRTTRRLVEERARQALLNNELNHRVKNTLASVQSIAVQTFGKDESAARGPHRLRGPPSCALPGPRRADPDGMGRRRPARGGRTRHGALRRPGADHLARPGDPARLAARDRDFHGAARAGHQRSEVRRPHPCRTAGSSSPGERRAGRLRLDWRETGGPPVDPPAHEGFGLRLLKRGLAGELGGSVEVTFGRSGLVCDIDAPLREA